LLFAIAIAMIGCQMCAQEVLGGAPTQSVRQTGSSLVTHAYTTTYKSGPFGQRSTQSANLGERSRWCIAPAVILTGGEG
jgi:hypothetical protein